MLAGLKIEETQDAVHTGYNALDTFGAHLHALARTTLAKCAESDTPCILVIARPHHMDPGISHEIEVDCRVMDI